MAKTDRAGLQKLKKEAYVAVTRAYKWIHSLARAEEFSDEYTRRIGTRGEDGAMPVAELLMCLMTTTESKYVDLNLPQPETPVVNRTTEILLDRVDKYGFSGVPYVVRPDDADIPVDPPFTDAVCYVAGALTPVLKSTMLDERLATRCKDVLLDCVRWLLAASVSPPEGKDHSGLQGRGWSWSSPAEIAREPALAVAFSNQLPPQTYFTSQVLTTLHEVLFEQFDLLETQIEGESLICSVFEAVADAKSFLLSSILVESTAGWIDFPYAPESDSPYTELPSQRYALEGELSPRREMAFYPIEALAYVRFYTSYTRVTDYLTRNQPAIYARYSEFDESSSDKLEAAFIHGAFLLKQKKLSDQACQIQLPLPLNRNADGHCWYVDGTVAYNVLNSFRWYADRFDRKSEQRASLEDLWDDGARVVAPILQDDIGFSEQTGAFLHSEEGHGRVPAIYATRTAIAALVSWGVSPVQSSDDDITNLMTQLTQLLEERGRDRTRRADATAGSTTDLDVNHVTSLLRLGYFVGGVASAVHGLANKKGASDTKSVFWGDVTVGPTKGEEIIKVNGIALLAALATLVARQGSDGSDAMAPFLKADHLIRPYKEFFDKNLEQFAKLECTDSLKLLETLPQNVRQTFDDAAMAGVLDSLMGK